MTDRKFRDEQVQKLRDRWDSDIGLQAKYGDNFKTFLAHVKSESGNSAPVLHQGLEHINPRHCF